MSQKSKNNLQYSWNRCDDVLQCVLSLNPLEARSYKVLVREGPMRVAELGEKIGKDRSTAYRCLKGLISCGICTKQRMTMERGGYFHVYFAVPPEEVKTRLKECTEQWYRKTHDAIEGFPY